MATEISVDNYGSINTQPKDVLTADVAAGANQISISNTNSIVQNLFVVIGAVGTDTCELNRVASNPSTATVVQLATPLRIGHGANDQVNILNADQIKLYRAVAVGNARPADSLFSVLTTTNITYNDQVTIITDIDTGDFWYKFSYYNSITGLESALSDSTLVRSGGAGYYVSVEQIRGNAGFKNNQFITDADIDVFRLEAQSEIDSTLSGMYNTPFAQPVDPMIAGITKLLAAGKLINDQYSGTNGGNTTEGDKKIADARAMLTMIANRQYELTDGAGGTLVSSNSASSKAFPNAQTPSLPPEQGGSHRNFRMSDVQGYYGRKY